MWTARTFRCCCSPCSTAISANSITHGHIYVARPPLFRVDVNAQGKAKPARKLYALDQSELDIILERLQKKT